MECASLIVRLSLVTAAVALASGCTRGSFEARSTPLAVGPSGKDGIDGRNGVDGKNGLSIVGPAGAKGDSVVGPVGPKGDSVVGPAGKNGAAVAHAFSLPKNTPCSNIGNTHYVTRDGEDVKIYSDSSCRALINDLKMENGAVTWVGNFMLTVSGKSEDTILLHKIEFSVVNGL